MSAINDVLDFYIKEAWTKSEDGTMVPSAALLADRGVKAMEFRHPTHTIEPPAESAVQASYRLSLAELADAMREMIIAMGMTPGPARTMKIGSATVMMQNAEYRIRSVTRS